MSVSNQFPKLNPLVWLKGFLLALLALLFSSCGYSPQSHAYKEHYTHLQNNFTNQPAMEVSSFFLIILVDARHLDYTDNKSLFKTIAKHPSDGSKNGDVGHAWVYLQGIIDGEDVFVEGGHSGELGITQAKYFEGVMNYIEYGYANPSKEQMQKPRFEPNPIKYLWSDLYDGYFQEGSGGHVPNFAVKIDLTEEQFNAILNFIHPCNYCYKRYSLTENQCSSFVARIAELADFQIEHEITMNIEQTVKINGEIFTLWEDPLYSQITFSSPDIIEKSLMDAVSKGRAEYALPWYKKYHHLSSKERLYQACDSLIQFPGRLYKALSI